MKHSIILILAGTFFLSCTKECEVEEPPGTNPDVNLTQGLIAYYPFSGNSNDESGNGHHGTIFNNAVIVADKNGKPASALSVDGSNGVIVPNGTTMVPSTEFTISFDVMQRSTGGRQMFLSVINYNTGRGFGYYIGPSMSGNAKTILGIARNGFDCSALYTEPANDIYGPIFEKESWYNVIVTFKNGALKMYSNGVLVGEGNAPSTTSNPCQNANLVIGNWWKEDPIGLNGKIDNVRIYNRVINADEIEALNE